MNIFLSVALLVTTLSSFAYANRPLQEPVDRWHVVVESPHSTFEWRVDPETDKMNFRRCHANERMEIVCLKPMLTQGIKSDQLATLIDYYLEKLAANEGQRPWQILKAFGVTSVPFVLGGLATFRSVAGMMPFLEKLAQNKHYLAAAGLALFTYYVGDQAITRYRELAIAREFRRALIVTPAIPPRISVKSQALFDEFSNTFREALYEFTHAGGVPHRGNINTILQ